MNIPTDPLFWAAGTVAVILTGIAKGGLGIAGGLSVPVLALVMSPVQGAAVMLPILVVMDWVSVFLYRREWDRANMKIILPAGLAGIGIGWATFRFLDEHSIRLLLGVIAVWFVLHALITRPVKPAGRSVLKGSFWAALAGVTSFVAHAGGPPLSVYLLPQRLQKAVHVGTTVVYFTVINMVKLVPYFALGLFNTQNLTASVMLAPIGAIGIFLGVWVQRNLSPTWFYRVSYILLAVTGVKLLWDGGVGMIG